MTTVLSFSVTTYTSFKPHSQISVQTAFGKAQLCSVVAKNRTTGSVVSLESSREVCFVCSCVFLIIPKQYSS